MTYAEIVLKEIKELGWDASVHRMSKGQFIAKATHAGHTCLAQDDDKYGACAALKRSVQEVEKGMGLVPGQVVRLKEPVGDVPDGYYVVVGVEGDVLTLSMLGEDLDTGELCTTEEVYTFPVTAVKMLREMAIRL